MPTNVSIEISDCCGLADTVQRKQLEGGPTHEPFFSWSMVYFCPIRRGRSRQLSATLTDLSKERLSTYRSRLQKMLSPQRRL